ncbi:MAG: ferredoxin family protein [Moraxellaceae bacterium]|nr:ferredoxin family protein [Moraxellaceae bacterium]
MIELISADRCIECNLCVKTCPRDVFDAVPNAIPVIARKEDCQTCFMCELYCPVDALFVAPHAEEDVQVDEEHLSESELLGSYVRNMGWRKGKAGGTERDPTRLLRIRNANAG